MGNFGVGVFLCLDQSITAGRVSIAKGGRVCGAGGADYVGGVWRIGVCGGQVRDHDAVGGGRSRRQFRAGYPNAIVLERI